MYTIYAYILCNNLQLHIILSTLAFEIAAFRISPKLICQARICKILNNNIFVKGETVSANQIIITTLNFEYNLKTRQQLKHIKSRFHMPENVLEKYQNLVTFIAKFVRFLHNFEQTLLRFKTRIIFAMSP